MSYQIETIPPFDKAVKRLTRKYRHIKYSKPEKADVSPREIEALSVELEEHLFGRGESEKTYQKLRERVG